MLLIVLRLAGKSYIISPTNNNKKLLYFPLDVEIQVPVVQVNISANMCPSHPPPHTTF